MATAPGREPPKNRNKMSDARKRRLRSPGSGRGSTPPSLGSRSGRTSGSSSAARSGGRVSRGRTPTRRRSSGKAPPPKATNQISPSPAPAPPPNDPNQISPSGPQDAAPATPEPPPETRQGPLDAYNRARLSLKLPPVLEAQQELEDDTEQRLGKRLLRLLTVSIVLVGIVGAVLLVLVVLFYDKLLGQEVCQTAGCENYARLLEDALDVSVNPCENFTQFVCDRWPQNRNHGFPEIVVTEAIERMARLVNVTYLPKSGQDSAQRGMALYRSCVAVLQGIREELAGVRAALKKAGVTWPIHATEIDIPHVILYTSLQLGWDVVFRAVPLQTRASWTLLLNKGRTIIEVLNKTSGTLASLKRREFFEELRRQLLPSRREINESYTSEVSFEEVNETEEVAVAALRRAYYRPEVVPPVLAKDVMDVPSIGLSRAGWEKTLLRVVPIGTRPSGWLEIATANTDYIDTFLKIWKELGNAKMHLFVSWCTVQVGALFGNRELIANFYGSLKAAEALHEVFCFSRAFAVSGPRLFSSYLQRSQSSTALSQARHLALSVRTSFHKRLLQWREYDEHATVIAKWDSLDTPFGLIQVGTRAPQARPKSPSEAGRGSGDPDKMFPDLDENALLSNLNKTSSWFAAQSGEYDLSSDVEVTEVLASLSTLRFTATFYGRPDLQIMPYAFAWPLFDVELVPGVNFGGLGAEIARALGTLTLKAYSQVKGPLESGGIMRKCFQSRSEGTNYFLALGEALALGALVDAYDAAAHRDERSTTRLPGVTSYTGSQLLFIAVCLPKCRGKITGKTPPTACNLPLMFLPEFSKAFKCEPGTPMNPKEQCELI